MGELLDRPFQRRLLQDLAETYPSVLNLAGQELYDSNAMQVNLWYLHEHGLVELSTLRRNDGGLYIKSAVITAQGLDFLSDDGGLGAILGVVTVKLHEDTIREILVGHVEQAVVDEKAKTKLLKKIKSIPSEALGRVVERALDEGLNSVPDIANAISSWLS